MKPSKFLEEAVFTWSTVAYIRPCHQASQRSNARRKYYFQVYDGYCWWCWIMTGGKRPKATILLKEEYRKLLPTFFLCICNILFFWSFNIERVATYTIWREQKGKKCINRQDNTCMMHPWHGSRINTTHALYFSSYSSVWCRNFHMPFLSLYCRCSNCEICFVSSNDRLVFIFYSTANSSTRKNKTNKSNEILTKASKLNSVGWFSLSS